MTVDVAPTAHLLAAAFPGSRIADEDYLDWLYRRSPFGPVAQANADDGDGRTGHYAVVPVDLICDGAPEVGALSLNTAVAERARGQGLFTRLADETYAVARARGITRVIGVSNANSTRGMTGRLRFRLVAPLPATVVVPVPGRSEGVVSGWADADAFAPGGIAADLGRRLTPPRSGLARTWTAEQLAWRLSAPGSRYAIHRSEDALAISTVDRRRAVPVAIVLAVLAEGPVDSGAFVRAICRLHRAPVALHVGVSDVARFRGIPLPGRLRESPLNLIDRRLDGDNDAAPFARMEFLDFDAY